jgi:hypothetical protein
MLLRIPGVGVRGAQRIMYARRERALRFDDLRRLNVTLKRAKYFITCNGAFAKGVLFDPLSIYRELTGQARDRRFKGVLDGQLSLFEAQPESATSCGQQRQLPSALADAVRPQPLYAEANQAQPLSAQAPPARPSRARAAS